MLESTEQRPGVSSEEIGPLDRLTVFKKDSLTIHARHLVTVFETRAKAVASTNPADQSVALHGRLLLPPDAVPNGQISANS